MNLRNLLRYGGGVALALVLTVFAAGVAEAQPRVSPMATTSQTIGVSELSITYSRPSVSERTIWGELVPYDQVWRTGANEATTFTVSDDVKVNGKALAAGTYALFTIPGKDSWTVIFNKEAEQWGAFQYKDSEDALRISVKPQAAAHAERFGIAVPEVTADTVTVVMHWEKVAVPFEVAFDILGDLIAKARAFVKDAGPNDGRQVWNWANYMLRHDLHTDEAEGWAANLAQVAPMYWTYALQARLEAHNGKKEAATATAAKALERAEAEAEQPGVSNDSANLAKELETWKTSS